MFEPKEVDGPGIIPGHNRDLIRGHGTPKKSCISGEDEYRAARFREVYLILRPKFPGQAPEAVPIRPCFDNSSVSVLRSPDFCSVERPGRLGEDHWNGCPALSRGCASIRSWAYRADRPTLRWQHSIRAVWDTLPPNVLAFSCRAKPHQLQRRVGQPFTCVTTPLPVETLLRGPHADPEHPSLATGAQGDSGHDWMPRFRSFRDDP